MKAAVLQSLGQPPRYEDFPDPVPAESEVLVDVSGASLKPVDRQLAAGSHYASPRQLPAICGLDGVGRLPSGERIYFGGVRPPLGGMAQRTAVRKAFAFPIPSELNDEQAAALPNPGVSAWLSLTYRAKLQAGENVLILGATGVTGQLALQVAKLLGAGRIVAAGRNPEVLLKLRELGADATLSLDVDEDELRQSFLGESRNGRFQVVLDYLWGHPAEVFLETLIHKEFATIEREIRFLQIGESAGPVISLPAAVLRSAAVTILGTAGVPPHEILLTALRDVLQHGASGKLRVATERVPLSEVESAWNRESPGRRVVFVP
ncbi:MAG TPA: zinc-binding alcohol dehydrogenase family protein [Candidatus Koribacter sp.]|jgi:NADPH2:quinone reductase